MRIGAIHRLDYNEAIVLTHDKWKFDAGGIPQYAFLLATARDVDGADRDDDEVLLLRVDGTAPLAMESDLHAVREEALRAALSSNGDASPSVVLDVSLDPFTKNRVSFTGLRCRILGTFYEDDVDGKKRLDFGADVDNFYATSTYRVLKPIGEGLSEIASYLKPSDREVERVRIGSVRYSATRRRAKAAKQDDSAVMINIHDFIGTKTGLLGMTRMGKSNTAKIIIARTFAVSERRRGTGGTPIGQLIFDPQGEYANPNTQDGTEIAAIGERHVRIFKFGASSSEAHVRPLGINFFDPAQVEAVQGLIADKLRSDGAAGYINDFAVTRFTDVPNDYSETTRAMRGRLILYAALIRAGFTLPSNNAGTSQAFSVKLAIRESLRNAITQKLGKNVFTAAGSRTSSIKGGDICSLVDKIIELRDAGDSDAKDFCEDVRWTSTEPIYTGQTSASGKVRGWRNLLDLKDFHNEATDEDPSEEIYRHLTAGRIVIVDLHVGSPPIIKALSESITRRLLAKQTLVFTSGQEPPSIQVMLEEAHNLFSSDKYKDDGDVWVKLAKEAAKLNIGMTYATQEVSGVAHQVKANTANWVVAHLNNTKEVQELSRFYDFAAFASAIITSEDRGYVRLKTLSSPFIVPVQIDRYDLNLVNEARAAAGDPALIPSPRKA
ncbi:helicase HerA domain-containing protein [Streptomyces sp. NPDC059819]|uniref:helicase HerA domain-containing protein n=1 Tax=Streptomyces sp. NPDC059819 TaxID=3346963 RepID=UPI003656CC1B